MTRRYSKKLPAHTGGADVGDADVVPAYMKPDIIDHLGIQPPEQVKRAGVGVGVSVGVWEGGRVGGWVGAYAIY